MLDKPESNTIETKAAEGLLAQDPPLDRFQQEVSALEKEPKPANGSAIFIGSSTFARWKDLEHDFQEVSARNLAFGGSTIPEINHYFDDLFTGFKPKELVFYAGTNDIGDEHHSGERVYEDFISFEKRFHQRFPDADLYFVSMSVAPCRIDAKADYDIGNKLIHDYMDIHTHDHYIDVTPVMYDTSHKLKEQLFQSDHLHMTKAGYELWEPIIKNAIEKS